MGTRVSRTPARGALTGPRKDRRPRRPLLPASPAARLLPCRLCTNMWMTCAQRRRACAYAVEMLGIPRRWPTRKGLYLGEREILPVP